MKIGNRVIGENYPPLVIAEMGINHQGDLETAKTIVDAAGRAGAEIIKHQTHIIDDEMSRLAKKVIPGNAKQSIYEIMERCALNEHEEFELKKYVEKKGMIFLSTPFSRAAANRLESFDVQAYKIGSGECNNYPLIEHIAQFNKPIILSTGMNDIPSIIPAVEILKKYKIDYALLHCTNLYPTPASLVRLGGMQALKEAFPDALVGLSDHTVNNNACLAAIALGACIVERHFIDHKQRKGPDIVCSMDEGELKSLIQAGNEIQLMRGGNKEAAKEEKITQDFAFATVVSIQTIEKGAAFSASNIWVKRPGIGEILAKDFYTLLGKKAKRKILPDQHIGWKDIL